MIIDARLRPPIAGILESSLYQSVGKTEHPDFPRLPSTQARSLPMLIEEMNEAGIDLAVVPGRYSLEPFGTVKNQTLAGLFGQYPGRFVGFMGVDLRWSTDEILAEIDRCFRIPGFVGVSLEPTISLDPSFSLMTDKRLYPIYDECVRRNIPVNVTLSGVLQAFTKQPYEWGSPIQAYKVAMDFPKLDIHIAHAGYPFVMEMIGVCMACPNIWLAPDLYMTDLFPGAQEYAKAVRNYLSDRTVFGSNYPTKPFTPMIEAYRRWDWPEATFNKVMGDNARRLLRLD
ncbi:amidohydrolase family protein [Devosia sp. A369]